MNRTIHEISDDQYEEYINEQANELCFTKKDLAYHVARSIGKSESAYYSEFNRCLKEGKPLSNEEKGFIADFINDKSHFGTFSHIPSDVFYDAVSDLTGTLSVSQEELERVTSISQAKISKALRPNSKTRFTTEEQFKILDYLLSRCFINKERKSFYRDDIMINDLLDPATIYMEYMDVVSRVNEMLHLYSIDLEKYKHIKEQRLNPYDLCNDILLYLTTLSDEDQQLISDNPFAFFDTLLFTEYEEFEEDDEEDEEFYEQEGHIPQITYTTHGYDIDEFADHDGNFLNFEGIYHYDNNIDYLDLILHLPCQDMNAYIADIKHIAYGNDYFAYHSELVCEIISQKLSMMKKARERNIKDPVGLEMPMLKVDEYYTDPPRKENHIDKAENYKRLEKALYGFVNFDIYDYPKSEYDRLLVAIIDGINYRLRMSPVQWYIDMISSICHCYTWTGDYLPIRECYEHYAFIIK